MWSGIADEGWVLNDKFVIYSEDATNKEVTMQMQPGYENGELRCEDGHWRFYPIDEFRQGYVSIIVTSIDNPSAQCYLTFTMYVRLDDLIINPNNLSMDVPKEEWVDMGDYTGIDPDYFMPNRQIAPYMRGPVGVAHRAPNYRLHRFPQIMRAAMSAFLCGIKKMRNFVR